MAKMRGLIINDRIKAEIARIIAYAHSHPIDAQEAIRHAERDITGFKRRMIPYTIDIPVGYVVTFSIERQPPGLCRHISISVDRDEKLPHPAAVDLLGQEFGMGSLQAVLDRKELSTILKLWVEDYANGRQAVNILQLITGPEAAA